MCFQIAIKLPIISFSSLFAVLMAVPLCCRITANSKSEILREDAVVEKSNVKSS